jgi:hypothetical protein
VTHSHASPRRATESSMTDVEFPDLGEEPAREAVVSIVERVAA